MAVNKVVYGSTTLIDLTGDTVTAAKLLEGETAHAANGEVVTGTVRAMTTAELYAAIDAAFTAQGGN